MTTSIPQDAREREMALDTSLSCCVQAPAGSGKTELLTQRILKLLASCERPEEVLAITFTRKAAAEMRNRLIENLEEASNLTDADLAACKPHKQYTLSLARAVLAQDQHKGWSLLSNTSRLRINTIDSFNQFLVNQLPVTSALGMLPDITEKPREIYREAVRDMMTQLDSETHLADELKVLLLHLNNRWSALEELLCGLLDRRDQWLSYIFTLRNGSTRTRDLMEGTLSGIIQQNLQELDQALGAYLPRLLPALQFAVSNLQDTDCPLTPLDIADSLPDTTPAQLACWQCLLGIMLKKDWTPRQKLTAAQGFPAQSAAGSKEDKALRKQNKADMEEVLGEMAADTRLLVKFEEIGFLPDSRFGDSQWRVLESLTVILPELVSRLSLAFAHHGKTDYSHVSAAALDALGDEDNPTDLALRLDYHLRHILVDEFQDTSSLQIRLLRKLTSGWQPGDGRTLFIVGDGMQSCYGFRNARVGLFLAARDNGIGDIRFQDLRLSCNFRSEAAVVDWVNTVFREAFPAQDDISRGGVSFNTATAVHESTPAAGVSSVLVCAEKSLELPSQVQRHQEALQVADTIEQIRTDYPDDTIAVLVRGKSHLLELIPVLRQRQLQWQASDIDPLLSYPVVRDLLQLVRALLNPGDEPAWLAFARSPLAGLRLQDMETLALHAEARSLSFGQVLVSDDLPGGLSDDATQILSRVQPLLSLSLSRRQRLPLRDWVENTWLLLGGPATVAYASLAENIEQFFNLLEEHDEGGDIRDIHLFEAELQSLFGSGQVPDAKLQIMTIHKAKGLEFHHVLIPGLDRRPRGNENPLLLWKEHITTGGEDRLVMSLPSRRARDHDTDPVYRYLKYELELEQRLESTRLLYIGVTRAIRQCVLFACLKQDEGAVMEPVKTSLLARIWPQLEARMDTACRIVNVDDGAARPETPAHKPDQPIRSTRLPPEWQNPLQALIVSEPPPVKTEFQELPHHNLLERKTGDILHYCLMLMSRGDLDPFDDDQIRSLEPVWQRQLVAVTDAVDDAVNEIWRQIRACREHEQFHWLVQAPHEEAASELDVSDFSSGQYRQFIIDRTFVDPEGQRWIIDYKSSRLPPGQSLSQFVQQQSERYRDQLERYARLFQAMEQKPVRKALFFTSIPCFVELSLDTDSQGS